VLVQTLRRITHIKKMLIEYGSLRNLRIRGGRTYADNLYRFVAREIAPLLTLINLVLQNVMKISRLLFVKLLAPELFFF